ncbi:hypothetical protein B0H13DRAFT_1902270 [Mycena leptocephala]|nr:hypothetical protein B0H13DRAFT_1902270 [Mycena leptocephala]
MPSTFDESKLPINWGKNSLQFDGQQPEELRKFLTSLETIFVTSKATTDAEKKIRSVMRTTPLEALPSYKADKVLWEAVPANKGLPFVPEARDDDDKYVWTDMVAAATRIVDEESSSFFESVSSSAKSDKKQSNMEKTMAQHMDKFTAAQHKEMVELKHISAMDKARDYHERRHVSQNYDELMDHYFGEEPSAEYDSKPDEIRTLKAELAMLQRQQTERSPRASPRKTLIQEESGDKARLDSALESHGTHELIAGYRSASSD